MAEAVVRIAARRHIHPAQEDEMVIVDGQDGVVPRSFLEMGRNMDREVVRRRQPPGAEPGAQIASDRQARELLQNSAPTP
jgi:hypothetical protein